MFVPVTHRGKEILDICFLITLFNQVPSTVPGSHIYEVNEQLLPFMIANLLGGTKLQTEEGVVSMKLASWHHQAVTG